LTTLQAQRQGVMATINLEELHLSFLKRDLGIGSAS